MSSEKKQRMMDALKKIGYNSRQVSVRQRPCTYSSSYTFTIRDPKVNYNAVEKVVKGSESIDWCPITQEILSGGNTFTHLSMTDEVEKAWSQKYESKVKAAIEELEKFKAEGKFDYGVSIDERFTIFCHNGSFYKVCDNKEGGSKWLDMNYYGSSGLVIDLFIITQGEEEEIQKAAA